MIEKCKTIGGFLLGCLWSIFCGILVGVLFIFHGGWLLMKILQQRITRKTQCLDESPIYGFIELLVLLPLFL